MAPSPTLNPGTGREHGEVVETGDAVRSPRAWRAGIALAIEVLLVVGIGWVLYRRRAELGRVLDVDAHHVAALALLCLAAAPIRAIELASVTGALGKRLSFREGLALTQAATLLNYLPMQAGTVLRARVLKQHRSLSYARYVAVMSCLVLLSVITGSVCGLGVLPFATGLSSEVRTTAALGFVALAAIGTIVFIVPFSRFRLGRTWFAARFRDLLTGWDAIRANRRALLVVCATSMSTPVLLGLRFSVCFHALSMPVHLPEALLLSTAILVYAPVNLTPGGLGVRELIGTAVGVAAGLELTQVLAAVTIDRVINLVVSLGAGGASWGWLRRQGLTSTRPGGGARHG